MASSTPTAAATSADAAARSLAENLLGGVEEEDANLERRAEFEAHALAPAILAARAVAPSSAAA